MTDNDVCRVSRLDVTLGLIIVLNCQAHFEKAKQKLCLISGNLIKLKIDYCNRVFTGIALLYPVLTEVMQALPYLA